MTDVTEVLRWITAGLGIMSVLLTFLFWYLMYYIIMEVRPTVSLHMWMLNLLRANQGHMTGSKMLYVQGKEQNESVKYMLERIAIVFSPPSFPSFKEILTVDLSGYNDARLVQTE